MAFLSKIGINQRISNMPVKPLLQSNRLKLATVKTNFFLYICAKLLIQYLRIFYLPKVVQAL